MKGGKYLFNPSTSKKESWNLIKTLIQTSIFWFVFLYLIPVSILKAEGALGIQGFKQQMEVGWALFIFFSLLALYTGYTMSWYGKGTPLPVDCPNELVIRGPYKIVRNPMALTGIGQGISVGIITGSFSVIFYSLIGAILWHLVVRPIEEKDLEQRFGATYIIYKKSTRCWVPKWRESNEKVEDTAL